VLLDGVLGDYELGGDAVVGAAFGHYFEDVALARRELGDWVVVAVAADEVCDDCGVDRGAAFCDAADDGAEIAHVGDTVLEQVADAVDAVSEELYCVAQLDVLRERDASRTKNGPKGRRVEFAR
jgi:hypothetical protein